MVEVSWYMILVMSRSIAQGSRAGVAATLFVERTTARKPASATER